MAAKATSHWPITITNGAVALFSIVLPLAVVRILSPEQVGRYNIFFLYVMLTPGLFLTGGLNNGLYHWAGKYPEAKPEIRQSWTLLLAVVLAFCLLGLVLIHWIAPLVDIPKVDLELVFISSPFIIASLFLEDLMIARGQIWIGSLYASGFNLLRILSLLAAAWWTRSMTWVLGTFVAGAALRAFVGWALASKPGDLEPLFSRKKTNAVLRFALPVSIAGVAGLAIHKVDQMILSFRLNPVHFAFYAMGCLSIPPLQILEMSVNRVMIPKLSQAFAENKPSEAARLFSEGVAELFRFLLPATLGLMIYSRPIVQILYTDRYMPAAGFLQIYALVYVISSIPYDAVARSQADSAWILRTYLIFSLLCAPITWLAAGKWGAMGALTTVVSSQLLMGLYSLHYDKKCFRVPLSELLPLKEMGENVGLAAAATACVIAMRPLFADSRVWFLVTGPLFTVIYLGGVFAIALRRHSRGPGPIPVLELAQTLGLGGLERTVYTIAQALHQHERFKVLVATYDHPEGTPSLAPLFHESGIPLMQWQKGRGFSFRSVARLIQIIFSEKTRIVHVHDLGPLVYGSLARIFSFGRIRLVLTLHTLRDVQESRRYRAYYKFFLRFPHRIIAVSPGVRDGLVALGVRPERVRVIANGVFFSGASVRAGDEAEKLARRKEILPGLREDLYAARWILCLARLHPGKGQDVVLDIWSDLPKEVRAHSALLFVGQKTHLEYSESLAQKAHNAPEADRIQIVGPSERPQDWIQSSDIFISGSLHEGMPLAPLEAVGSGLPVLLSDIEGHRFLQPWASYFDLRKQRDGAAKLVEILETLQHDGEKNHFESRWQAAASVRERWGVPAMSASYAAAFELKEKS